MKFILLISLLFSLHLQAQEPLPQSPGPDVLTAISEHNLEQAQFESLTASLDSNRQSQVMPFAEYEKTGYVFFNDDDYWGYAEAIKRGIAENLPIDVTLVIYSTSTSPSHLESLKEKYSEYMDPTRLVVLQIPRSGSNNFWTRDNLPVPVWTEGQFTLVDARYYYNFEPDDFLAELFSTNVAKHPYFFEGGNFITNSRGECIVVNRRRSYPGGNSDTAAIPDSVFKDQYGCKQLTRFNHLKGIGHADEVVKFITDDVVVTDTEDYVEILEQAGYEVHLLPEPDRQFETYVNSLQVNNVMFVPSFGESGDQQAAELFQQLNPQLKVVSLPTRDLATQGQGGIHCITMNYPPVPLKQLIQTLNAKLIH